MRAVGVWPWTPRGPPASLSLSFKRYVRGRAAPRVGGDGPGLCDRVREVSLLCRACVLPTGLGCASGGNGGGPISLCGVAPCAGLNLLAHGGQAASRWVGWRPWRGAGPEVARSALRCVPVCSCPLTLPAQIAGGVSGGGREGDRGGVGAGSGLSHFIPNYDVFGSRRWRGRAGRARSAAAPSWRPARASAWRGSLGSGGCSRLEAERCLPRPAPSGPRLRGLEFAPRARFVHFGSVSRVRPPGSGGGSPGNTERTLPASGLGWGPLRDTLSPRLLGWAAFPQGTRRKGDRC